MFCMLDCLGCWPTDSSQVEWQELDEAASMVKPFTYENNVWKAKIISVLDGETVQAVMKNSRQIESHRIRLDGIDSLQEGKAALEKKLLEDDGYCIVTLSKDDPYGRRLGVVTTRKGENLCEWMVSNGFATSQGVKEQAEDKKEEEHEGKSEDKKEEEHQLPPVVELEEKVILELKL